MNATVAPTLYSTPHVTASPRASHNSLGACETLEESPIPKLTMSRTAKPSNATPVTAITNLSEAFMIPTLSVALLAQRGLSTNRANR